MKKYSVSKVVCMALLLSSGLPVFGEDEHHYLSVVPGPAVGVVKPAPKPAVPGMKAPAKPAPAGQVQQKPAPDANGNANQDIQENNGESNPVEAAPTKSFYSATLEQAVRQYKQDPNANNYGQVLAALKSTLVGAGALRLSPAVVVKDNPYLNDFKPKVTDTNGLRIWTFPKAPEKNRALLQWFDVHQQVVGKGRHKKVLTSTTMRFQEMSFSQPINLKDAGIVSGKDSGKHLLIAGDADDGSLSVQAFKMSEAGWVESPEFLSQIPAFLTTNVCGRLSFRGTDLIYNVGKMIQTSDSNGTKRYLPEAESATYKFWLKSTDSGFVVAPSVPNEDSFTAVYQFMKAVEQGKTDVEKAMLADARLVSLPKYLGLQGRPADASTRVVEMSLPPGRGQRFRLINIGRDDVIFDVIKFKGQWQIKAIFIAPPDTFLAETSKYFPMFSNFEPKIEAKKDDSQQDAPSGGTARPGAAVPALNGRRK